LVDDLAALSERFTKIFDGLTRRILWHRVALVVVGGIALLGAGFATAAFNKFTIPDTISCLSGKLPIIQPAVKG
jgi:hypothetical protein